MSRTLATLALLAGLGTTAIANPAHAETWVVDATHSHVGFKVRHMMVSWVRGEFGTFEGVAETDSKGKLTGLVGTVTIDSVDTDDQKRDGHLQSPDFFDTANHPTMQFKSTKVKASGSGYDIMGDLTIRGVTKPVTFKADGLPTARLDPWGNTKTGTSMTTTINRQDFGVTWNNTLDGGGYVVGDDVEITVDLELNKAKPDAK